MNAAETRAVSSLDRIVVTSGNGKVYDLGNPHSVFFRARVWWYCVRRYLEK